MKNLGSLIVLLLFTAALHASVTASIDKPYVQKGENVTLTLAVSGENHAVPEITTLCNTEQIERAHRQKPDSSEGSFREIDLYSYRFAVSSDCHINPILIEVDGVEHYSSAFEIKVRDTMPERAEGRVVTLRSSANRPYVGEALELEITVQEPKTQGVSEVHFVTPILNGLWIKKVDDLPPYKEGMNRVEKRLYRVTPQRAGMLHIDPVEVKIAKDEQDQDAWGNPKTTRIWESRYSNALDLDVQAVPEGVHAVGVFSIAMNIEDTIVDADMPVQTELVIQGWGNFEDMRLKLPSIDGVTVVAEEPLLENAEEKDHECWRQRLAFVSDHSFVIPSVRLEYFDLEEKRVKTVYTEAVAVNVLGSKKKKEDNIKESRMPLRTVWSIGVLISIALLSLLSGMYYRRTTAKRYACSHHYKEALRLLLGHKDEEGVNEMVEALEQQIYGGVSNSVDLKKLKALCKKYA